MISLHPWSERPRGFTLLEALVALLVLSFGMLAIAGFQTTLSRNSDLAKQRTEAMRLAQQKMEALRSYGQVATSTGTPHIFNYTDDVVSGTDSTSTNTNATFSRTWTVTPNSTDSERWVRVQVAWNDRAGQSQSVQLVSVISKFDPADIGTLGVGSSVTAPRKPKNRNINIPYPAVTLSGGTRSAFIPPPGNITYVFDNTTGTIVQSCTGLSSTAPTPVTISNITSALDGTVTVTASGHTFAAGNSVIIAGTGVSALNGTFTVLSVVAGSSFTYSLGTTLSLPLSATTGTATLNATQLVEGLDLTASTAVCTSINAYLLSGYVRFDTGNNPTGAEPGNPGNNNNTLPLDVSTPLSINTSNQSTANGTPTMTCYAQRQQVVSTGSQAPSAVTITSLSRSGSTVTVTAASHGFSTGQTVAINATNPTNFIGSFVVTVVNANTFTYTLPPPLPTVTSATGGTAKLVERLTVPEGPLVSPYTTLVAKFIAYTCVVTPIDHDLSAATAKRWWGRVTLNPNSNSANGTTWTIGNGNGNYKVCRFSADYNGDSAISNSEHPQWYRGVTGALDSQNYLVISAQQSCPTDKPADPLSNPVNYSDDTTALQQPTDNAVLSFQCGSGNNCNGTTLEPSNTATDALMD